MLPGGAVNSFTGYVLIKVGWSVRNNFISYASQDSQDEAKTFYFIFIICPIKAKIPLFFNHFKLYKSLKLKSNQTKKAIIINSQETGLELYLCQEKGKAWALKRN